MIAQDVVKDLATYKANNEAWTAPLPQITVSREIQWRTNSSGEDDLQVLSSCVFNHLTSSQTLHHSINFMLITGLVVSSTSHTASSIILDPSHRAPPQNWYHTCEPRTLSLTLHLLVSVETWIPTVLARSHLRYLGWLGLHLSKAQDSVHPPPPRPIALRVCHESRDFCIAIYSLSFPRRTHETSMGFSLVLYQTG